MSDLDALFRAVLARPDDDTPRLVYADALDDLGHADRAAFVRNQVEAARAEPWEPAAIRVRCFRGDAPLGAKWWDELPELPAGLGWAPRPFRRGFPALVEATDGAAFVAAADRLFDLAPVESLELLTLPAQNVASLARCPALGRLKRLAVRAGMGPGTAERLLNSPHLAGLPELVIGAGLTSRRTAAGVVGSLTFRGLRAFAYQDDEPGEAMARALAALADPPPLRVLDLRSSRLTRHGVGRVAGAGLAAGLEQLDIGDNHVGPDGFLELGRGALPALRRLDIMRTGPGLEGLEHLLPAPVTRHLWSLNLGGNALGAPAGSMLGVMLPEVRVLDLRDNRLGDAGATYLARFRFDRLLHLDLSENGVTAAGAAALLDAPWLDGVIALDLGGNPLPADAKARLRDRLGERALV